MNLRSPVAYGPPDRATRSKSEELDPDGQARPELGAVLYPRLQARRDLERDVHVRVRELEPLEQVAQYDLVLEDRCGTNV